MAAMIAPRIERPTPRQVRFLVNFRVWRAESDIPATLTKRDANKLIQAMVHGLLQRKGGTDGAKN